jgi:hypothetical protein
MTATPAAALPYMIRGEVPFNWTVGATTWTTSAYPATEVTRGSPPYTTWTAPVISDPIVYGGNNTAGGISPTWCTPAATYTTFQVARETSDKVAGTGSLKLSGQSGGYTWGGLELLGTDFQRFILANWPGSLSDGDRAMGQELGTARRPGSGSHQYGHFHGVNGLPRPSIKLVRSLRGLNLLGSIPIALSIYELRLS